MPSAADVTQAYRTWMCVVCGFIYNEAEGLPEEGIDPGTRWEDIPDTWTCPDCGTVWRYSWDRQEWQRFTPG